MRLVVLIGALVSALGLASVAAATPPTHTSQTLIISQSLPAGTFCDVNVNSDFTLIDDVTTFSNGRTEDHTRALFTYTNLDTGSVVTAVGRLNDHSDSTGSNDQGLFPRLRDASGKVVSVNAGQVRFDSSFQVVAFTPNTAPSLRAVVCPALGANPA